MGGPCAPDRCDADGSLTITHCQCGPLPEIEWAGHEDRLPQYRTAAGQVDNPPFAVPAQGMGLFSCRREAWLGFNPNFRGFGGEEFYIHEKYRQAGRRTVCLPLTLTT